MSLAKKRGVDSLESINTKDRLLEFLYVRELVENLSKRYNVNSTKKLIRKVKNDKWVPISVFTKKLATLETVCKYLKENLNLSNKKIADLIGRNSKSVWQAYNSSKRKMSEKLNVTYSSIFIPVSILKNKNMSPLESVVFYLKKEAKFSYREIAILLKRDDSTIWVVYNKARIKNE